MRTRMRLVPPWICQVRRALCAAKLPPFVPPPVGRSLQNAVALDVHSRRRAAFRGRVGQASQQYAGWTSDPEFITSARADVRPGGPIGAPEPELYGCTCVWRGRGSWCAAQLRRGARGSRVAGQGARPVSLSRSSAHRGRRGRGPQSSSVGAPGGSRARSPNDTLGGMGRSARHPNSTLATRIRSAQVKESHPARTPDRPPPARLPARPAPARPPARRGGSGRGGAGRAVCWRGWSGAVGVWARVARGGRCVGAGGLGRSVCGRGWGGCRRG